MKKVFATIAIGCLIAAVASLAQLSKPGSDRGSVSGGTAGTDFAKPSLYDTYANVAAETCGATEVGRLAFTSNSLYTARCTGSAWQWFYLGQIVTLPPAAASFTKSSPDATCTLTDDAGSLQLYCPAAATADLATWRIADAPPFTITARIIVNARDANFNAAGLAYTDGTKFNAWTVAHNTGSSTASWQFEALKWTTTDTADAAYAINQEPIINMRDIWLRIEDDGATNRVSSYSVDGKEFIALHTVGRTDHLTATAWALVIKQNNSTHPVRMTVVSLLVE